jgi:DNA-directed RNA polymerase alpha subunit
MSELSSIQEMEFDDLVALRDQIDAEIRRRRPPIEDKDIGDIGLTSRAENALRIAGIERVGGLLALTEGRLRCIPGLGLSSLVSIKESLDALGLSLRSGL